MVEYKTNMIKTIRAEMQQSLRACLKALSLIRKYQVGAEYVDGLLRVRNNMGYTRQDSGFLTYLSIKNAELGYLPEESYVKIQEMMPKYARQIFEILCTQNVIQRTETSKFQFNGSSFLESLLAA